MASAGRGCGGVGVGVPVEREGCGVGVAVGCASVWVGDVFFFCCRVRVRVCMMAPDQRYGYDHRDMQ